MLLESADAFGDQVAGYRRELFVHCYRMLGTVDEAEDALQEALAHAWKGRHTYREQISFRGWLYRIATNTCIDAIQARHRRRTEVGPCPDDLLVGLATPEAGPEARYDMHESVSLAFLKVLNVLPPRQRAALILCDVLAYRGAEVALLLETSVQAVNSSLQRARAKLRGSYARPAFADRPNLLARYVRAWEAADIAGLVALLRDDAVLSMPPKPSVAGAQRVADFLARSIFPMGPMRVIAVRANHGPALAAYVGGRPFALLLVDHDAERITHIYAYADPSTLARFDLPAELAP